MNWRKWSRQYHRWLSVAFVLSVLVVIGAGLGLEEPPDWVFVLPLAPLGFLVVTGVYLFLLPYLRDRRAG